MREFEEEVFFASSGKKGEGPKAPVSWVYDKRGVTTIYYVIDEAFSPPIMSYDSFIQQLEDHLERVKKHKEVFDNES
jgi:hypothetical protein